MSSYRLSREAFQNLTPPLYTLSILQYSTHRKAERLPLWPHLKFSHSNYHNVMYKIAIAYHQLGHVFKTCSHSYSECVVHVRDHAINVSKQGVCRVE
jgi:hypothetical protein